MQQTRTLPNNITVDTDAYKLTHHKVNRKDLTEFYSYGECRVGAKLDYVIPFGMQIHLIENLIGNVVVDKLIDEGALVNKECLGYDEYFNYKMWKEIKKKYNGALPLIIKAVPEGTRIPISNIMFSVKELDPIAVPLVNHIETELSHIWYTTTIVSNSFEIKKDIYKFLLLTGTPEAIEYMCHDFGYRGVTCKEQARRGGMSHLVNFVGSDTLIAHRATPFYYKTKGVLKSVFATEHSVAEQYGAGEGEYEYMLAVLEQAPDSAIASVVIDTYDALNFIDNVITRPDIKEKILKRAGKIVFRPDSGNPEEITNRILNSLGHNFGYTYNDKHYKVLNPRIGLIYGDGMERDTIKSLYQSIIDNKWSADNLVVGSGGGLLQKFNRDTNRFAIKASYGVIGGKEVNLIKNPKTQASKKSKTGMLKLHESGGKYSTISSANLSKAEFEGYYDCMETVFEMGELKREYTFDEIRQRAKECFDIAVAEEINNKEILINS